MAFAAAAGAWLVVGFESEPELEPVPTLPALASGSDPGILSPFSHLRDHSS